MYSLRRRLLISATLVLLVFLGIMGVGLNRAFERSVLSNAQETLRSQVLLLIGSIDVLDGVLVAPSVLSEPRLQQPDSGLFAQVYSANQGSLWRSQSLLDRDLPAMPSGLGDFSFYPSQAWEELTLNTMTLAVEWETETGTLPFVVQLAESNEVYEQRLAGYQRQTGLWLLVFGGTLIVLLLSLLGWALKPLERVRRQVNEIEEGARQRFDEDYPLEVSRLTQNLNQLLNFEEQRIERQKEVLGNLAHSLKTPIAVLKGLKFQDETKAEANEQLSTMQAIIDYQLQSASAVGRRRFAKPIKVVEITEQIIRSLDKLHAHKGLTSGLSIAPATMFYGDQGDWMEVVGNLCDNAFKWASKSVQVTIQLMPQPQSQSHRKPVQIIVEDDGPGIAADLKAQILQRGVRLDSQTPGHGIGLHIVKGIVEAYDGQINIEDALESDSGTRFTIVLN